MTLLWGDFEDAFDSIYDALVEVSLSDPLRQDKEGKNISHSDGWGYLSAGSGELTLRTFGGALNRKSPRPPALGGISMIHARHAAPGEPSGVLSSHPFHRSDSRFSVYLVHNGWFDKYRINNLLRMDNVNRLNDSEVFLDLLMSQEGDLKDRIVSSLRLSEEEGFIKGGANLFIVGIDRDSGIAQVHYYTDVNETKSYSEYIRLYSVEGNGWKGVVSSSLVLSGSFSKDFKTGIIERKKLYSVELDIN